MRFHLVFSRGPRSPVRKRTAPHWPAFPALSSSVSEASKARSAWPSRSTARATRVSGPLPESASAPSRPAGPFRARHHCFRFATIRTHAHSLPAQLETQPTDDEQSLPTPQSHVKGSNPSTCTLCHAPFVGLPFVIPPFVIPTGKSAVALVCSATCLSFPQWNLLLPLHGTSPAPSAYP